MFNPYSIAPGLVDQTFQPLQLGLRDRMTGPLTDQSGAGGNPMLGAGALGAGLGGAVGSAFGNKGAIPGMVLGGLGGLAANDLFGKGPSQIAGLFSKLGGMF